MKIKHLVIAIMSPALLFAQDAGKISGRVIDSQTKEPLPGANVLIRGTNRGSTSDPNGEYFILNIPPGKYEVSASYVGFRTLVKQDAIVNINRTTTIDFALQETTIEMGQEVVVVAERPDVLPEKTSTSEILRTEAIQSVPGVQDLTSVLALSTDVIDGHFRGGRDNEEMYTLAGMGILNPLTNAVAFAPIMSAVEEVEVITSGFSAQYGNAQSGVINISMKEGKSDRWRARAEVRSRFPGKRHFGASVFDENAQPYLQALNSAEEWGGADSSNPGSKYYSSISYGFESRYKDSVQASQIAYALWKQARRDLNRNYNDLIDYSLEVAVNGPLSRTTRLFLVGRVQNEWDFLPTPDPNVRRHAMGNLVVDVSSGMTLRFSGAYTNIMENSLRGLGSYSYTGFYNWIWDRSIGITRSKTENIQLGARFAHALSGKTYYDIKVNWLNTDYVDGPPVIDPARYVSDDQNNAIWRYYNTPDQFRVGSMDNDWRTEKTGTISLDGSLTSQVTRSHLILAGIQANLYSIDVNNETGMSSPGQQLNEIYAAKPFEFGVYAQDKMEFQGMIANIGLRFDYYNQNVDYYTDPYSPFRVYINDTTVVYDPELASKEATPAVARFQPRVGISFPVSTTTVFHMNYGSFLQRPAFERTVYMRSPLNPSSGVTLGNPRLKPQETNSYDVGVTQALMEGLTLDVSGFYKDVKNLIQMANLYDNAQNLYMSYVNRDYADIRGFHIALTQRKGLVTGKLSYNYGVATGKSSTPFNAQPIYYEQPPEGQPPAKLPSPKDILMDFDRTHNIILSLMLLTPEAWGPTLFDGRPFSDVLVSVLSFARSGRPYTYDTQGLGLINNFRTPNEYNTDLKISKRFRRLAGADVTLYLEVFNLFDQQIYSYNSVFQSASTTTGTSSTINRNAEKYNTDPASLQYYDEFAPFLVDQTFALYANTPRTFFLGIVINL